ncbi:hypothetical protein [Roseateles sp.]|uniref:hypothetical protein n=1 Tax=Roseateles sp. TaxID=1971397 RepID=UPI0039E8E087
MRKLLAPALAAVVGLGLWWVLHDEAAAPPGQAPVAAGAASAALPPTLPVPAEADAASALADGAVTPAALAAVPPAQALRALQQCYAANACRVSSREGMDEHFEVVVGVLQQLERLAAQGSTAEQVAAVRELLAFPDGHVQAAALALAAKLPPSAETVSAAVAALGKSYDAVLLNKAYPVLQQWQQLGLSSGYDDMFAGLVHTGGWQAAQSVAENVGPFLNAGNVSRFEQVARQLPPGARQQALLRTLRDYRLQQSGG